MVEKIKKHLLYLAWIPLVSGILGYWYYGGMAFVKAVYATAALYFVNPITDDPSYDNFFVYFAKFLAVIVTATVVLDFLVSFYGQIDKFKDIILGFIHNDSTVFYTDGENKQVVKVAKQFKHGFVEIDPKGVVGFTYRHVIMFKNDMESLGFYSEHKDEFEKGNKQVYMVLQDVDSSLIKKMGNFDFHYVNKFDLMARDYWRMYDLYEEIVENKKHNIKIAIIGYENVGKAIFHFGFMNNIYDGDQNIEYHIWGCSDSEKEFLKSLDPMNSDEVIVEAKEPSLKDIEIIAGMDRIILTGTDNALLILQKVLYRNSKAYIHYYSENFVELNEVYNAPNLSVFGGIRYTLKEDYIINEELYKMGKLLHYDYILSQKGGEYSEEEMNKEWKNIDGYKRESSIARADHYYIKEKLKDELKKNGLYDEEVDREIAPLEHMRWCRFMYINHFQQGDTNKPEERKHNLLLSYDDPRIKSHDKKDIISNDTIKKEFQEHSRNLNEKYNPS